MHAQRCVSVRFSSPPPSLPLLTSRYCFMFSCLVLPPFTVFRALISFSNPKRFGRPVSRYRGRIDRQAFFQLLSFAPHADLIQFAPSRFGWARLLGTSDRAIFFQKVGSLPLNLPSLSTFFLRCWLVFSEAALRPFLSFPDRKTSRPRATRWSQRTLLFTMARHVCLALRRSLQTGPG